MSCLQVPIRNILMADDQELIEFLQKRDIPDDIIATLVSEKVNPMRYYLLFSTQTVESSFECGRRANRRTISLACPGLVYTMRTTERKENARNRAKTD